MSTLATPNCPIIIPEVELQDCQTIERSIHKTYRRHLWAPFIRAIKEFNLIENGDRIAVAISGGKDSLLLAKLFQALQRTRLYDFELVFIAMNPGFHQENLTALEANLKHLQIPAEIYADNIFERAEARSKEFPCYQCAQMRRGSLYAKATEHGCNKLALGHHYDDVLETILLNIFYAGKFETMLPTLPAKNFDVQLIRPLYYVEEADIIRYTKQNGIQAMNCGCTVAAGRTASKRSEIKQLIKQLDAIDPGIKNNILSSTRNVNLEKILGWRADDK